MAKRSRADVKYAIDLLWTHQIRRENLSLHKEVQQLQESINRYTGEQQKLRVAAQNAETSAADALETVKSTSSTIQNLRTSLVQTTTLAEATSTQVADFPRRFESLQKDCQGTKTDFDQRLSQNEASFRQIRTQFDETVASLKTRFEETNRKIETRPDDESLENLHLRVQVLEQQFSEQATAAAALSHVSESIEPPEVQCIGLPEESDVQRDDDAAHSDGVVEEEEHMLTMRNVVMRDSTTDESLDLDANVSIPSYAMHTYRQPQPRDSLKPIEPTSSSDAQLRAQILALKQGRYHSHDRYLAEGQSLMDRIPEGQERFLIESFIRGLYSATRRDQCRQWLQLNGWQWEAVAAVLSSRTSSTQPYPNMTITDEETRSDHQCREHSLSSPQDLPGNAPLECGSISETAQSPRNSPPSPTQPRRSTRIAASQHPFRTRQQQPHNDLPRVVKKITPEQPPLNDKKPRVGTGRPTLKRPPLGASSIKDAPSVSSIDPRWKPASAQQQSPRAQPSSEADGQRLTQDSILSTPRQNISAFRATNGGSKFGVNHKKRNTPDDWLTTESEQDDSMTSDQVELPTNPPPDFEPRKRRRKTDHHNRKTILPPPEIPILSTSE